MNLKDKNEIKTIKNEQKIMRKMNENYKFFNGASKLVLNPDIPMDEVAT